MKSTYILGLCASVLLCLCSCSDDSSSIDYTFEQVDCNPEPTPAFDFNFMTLIDSIGNPAGELVDSIPKTRTVFKPCRVMTYRAVWSSDKGKEITNGQIQLVATGKRWDMQPEKQDEIIVQYSFSDEDRETAAKYQLNQGILEYDWMPKGVEGVVENEKEIWMHPFRFNQYNFTEVAPFPEVNFPLSVGKSWTGNLRIMEGWGDWENSRGNFNYEVVERGTVETAYGDIEDCWKIKSHATYRFGKSYFDYWFSETLGFVKMEYENYGGQRLVIELETVQEQEQEQ